MRISDVRLLCEPPHEDVRNTDICRSLNYVDEVLIYHVDREILNYDKSVNPLKNIDDILEGQARVNAEINGRPWYNTWPFGTHTEEIYSKFLAVCRGEQKLKGVFDVVIKQSKKIAEHYKNFHGQEKTVMILTDKWNYDTFGKYEKKLLNHAIQDSIWYIFLLVTDYGYTQIPFLPNDRNTMEHLDGEKIEDDLTFENILDMLQEYPFEYSLNGGTFQPFESVHYHFDIYSFCWEKHSLREGDAYGKIWEKDLKQFLKSVSWIVNERQSIIKPQVRALDLPTKKLNIFGRTIEWDAAFDEDGDRQYILLQKALDRFVAGCEKHTNNS